MLTMVSAAVCLNTLEIAVPISTKRNATCYVPKSVAEKPNVLVHESVNALRASLTPARTHTTITANVTKAMVDQLARSTPDAVPSYVRPALDQERISATLVSTHTMTASKKLDV